MELVILDWYHISRGAGTASGERPYNPNVRSAGVADLDEEYETLI